VTVAKAEKTAWMAYGASLSALTVDSQKSVFGSEAPKRGTFNDYPAREYIQANGKGQPHASG